MTKNYTPKFPRLHNNGIHHHNPIAYTAKLWEGVLLILDRHIRQKQSQKCSYGEGPALIRRWKPLAEYRCQIKIPTTTMAISFYFIKFRARPKSQFAIIVTLRAPWEHINKRGVVALINQQYFGNNRPIKQYLCFPKINLNTKVWW